MNDSNVYAYRDEPSESSTISSGGGREVSGRLLLVLLVGAAATFFFVDRQARAARLVWVVNGTQKAYDVEIDGQTYTLPYDDPLELELAEGTHTVRLSPPMWSEDVSEEAAAARAAFMDRWIPAAQERTFTMTSTLGLAAFDGTTFVLNPDGAAMLLESDVVYGNKNPRSQTLLPPGLFHAIEGIDDAFAPSPSSEETSSGTIRRRLDAFLYEERLDMLGFAGEPLGGTELKAQVAARLAMDFDAYTFQVEARKLLDDAEAEQLELTRATPTSRPSIIPPAPAVKQPKFTVKSAMQAAAEAEVQNEENRALADLQAVAQWALVVDELFSTALTEDISPSNGYANVAPLVAAIQPLMKGQTSDGAEQVLYLLRRQVAPSPDRLKKLKTLGVPARVRMGTLLVVARDARKEDAARARNAARELAEKVGAVPAAWAEALQETLQGPAAK